MKVAFIAAGVALMALLSFSFLQMEVPQCVEEAMQAENNGLVVATSTIRFIPRL